MKFTNLADSFKVQVEITKETYGLNGILGVYFMIKLDLIIDFREKAVIRK